MTLGRILRVLAAYLIVLHALGMAAMAAPVPSPDDPLGVICTVDGDQSDPTVPGHPASHQVPCALCGLGSCAVAAPSEAYGPAEMPLASAGAPRPEPRITVAARPCVVPPDSRGPPIAA
jgi:hypothetical protein